MPNPSQKFFIPIEALSLSDVELVEVELNRVHEFIITVASTKKEIPCYRCGRLTERHGKDRTISVPHLPMLGRKTFKEPIYV